MSDRLRDIRLQHWLNELKTDEAAAEDDDKESGYACDNLMEMNNNYFRADDRTWAPYRRLGDSQCFDSDSDSCQSNNSTERHINFRMVMNIDDYIRADDRTWAPYRHLGDSQCCDSDTDSCQSNNSTQRYIDFRKERNDDHHHDDDDDDDHHNHTAD